MKEVLPVRINKLLSNYGYCSRKQVNRYIREGGILVNGVPATEGQWVTEEDHILFFGKPVKKKPSVYYLYHKPHGVICTLDEEANGGLAAELKLPHYAFPVGRLDKDSEGLLFLTNDGDLAQKLLHGEGQVEKVPYLLVLGFNEVENNTVSYRLHGQADTTVVGLDEFVAKIEEEIKTKAKNR